MPHVSGTANTFAALRSALVAACTANGWTLSGDVLHKGGGYFQVLATADAVTLRGGTGIDGSSALTGAGPYVVRLAELDTDAVEFPVSYDIHVHANPDEVYLVVNHKVDHWLYLAFGVSDVAGLAGTGAWYAASMPQNDVFGVYLVEHEAGGQPWVTTGIGAFLVTTTASGGYANAFIHHGLDGGGWSDGRGISDALNVVNALSPSVPKYGRQPNAWNSNVVLLEYQGYLTRPDNKVSLVLDLAHARLVRVDNYAPGELVEGDAWKVYPWYRKNADMRQGEFDSDHTGTWGWAIRYDGP